MKRIIDRYKWLIIIVVLIIAGISAVFLYQNSQTKLMDNTGYKEIYSRIRQFSETGGFTDQQQLRDVITGWADENDTEYKVDKYQNIIFTSKAVSRKKNVSPTLVVVGYNYQTALSNARLLASAAMIAVTKIQSGKSTVIFCNDEQNEYEGYRHISKKILTDKTKVIYMDYGNSAYISQTSFAESFSAITVPCKKVKNKCDTAVRVSIKGVKSDEVTVNMSKHPDVIAAFSSMLTRLKSKSTVCQLADVEIGSNGNMYPVSLEATFLLNSYNVSSFTGFIEKRIKAWNKAYGKSFPELEFTYEVIDDSDELPRKAYSVKSTYRLASTLYTLSSSVYRYEESDNIPANREPGDTCGINYLLNIRENDGNICIDIMTQGYDKSYVEKINDDNRTAAELNGCDFETVSYIRKFSSKKNGLIRTLRNTYFKTNNVSNVSGLFDINSDNYFTPCSFLSITNNKTDIVHIRMNKDNVDELTNTILCYIRTKGNILSL